MFMEKPKVIFLITIGVLIGVTGICIWGFPKIISLQVQKNIQLEESSQMFEKWRKLPMPMLFKVNIFNVTNVEEVNQGGKPKLKEIGPYVYKQYRERTVLGYGPNDTVKYNLSKKFEFDQEASGHLSDNDELTVINFPYLAAVLTIQSMMPDMVGMMNPALEELIPNLTDPFLRIKVKDLLFDGLLLNCDGDNPALPLVCGQIKELAQPTMRPTEDGKGFYFSMFSHLNRSEMGPFEMVRGTKDINELGHILSYQGVSEMKNWGDPYCGMINGSDSTIFPPVNPNNIPPKLYSFEQDLCRSLYIDYVDKRKLFDLNAYYYEMSSMALAAKSANPNNKCFCKRNWSANHDGCLVMGVLNLLPCQGASVIASLPHFYMASEEIMEYVAEGIKPEREKHNTYVYIEQVTGVPMKGAKRLQFNIEIRKIRGVPQLENVRTGLFPLLWIEEGATIPKSVQDELHQSHNLLGYVEIVRWVILAAAILAVLGSAFYLARAARLPVWPRNQVTMVVNGFNGNK